MGIAHGPDEGYTDQGVDPEFLGEERTDRGLNDPLE
jgi:hypothetical protein